MEAARLGAHLSLWRQSRPAPRLSIPRRRDQFDATPDFHQRALILHGTEDQVVPYQGSYDFALEHARTRLVPFPSGHELTDVLEDLWRETAAFLEIPPRRRLGSRMIDKEALRRLQRFPAFRRP